MAYRPYIWRKNNPEKRLEQKRREKVRRSLRDKGILPPIGETMNEEQQKINDQISNNDFTYWDSIKSQKTKSGGIDKQTYIPIKSPEYLLWYRIKTKSNDRKIPFNLEVEDIVIPEICPITQLTLSTDYNNREENYYTLLPLDFDRGYVKGNIQVVSLMGFNIKTKNIKYLNKKHKMFSSPEYRMLCKTKKSRNKKEFNIDIEDIIIPSHCPYLNIELTTDKDCSSQPNYYSIDRIDSSKGYVKGNIQIISLLANTMKNNATKEQLITFSENILKLYKS
jgi:hypothetical protein